MFTCKNGKSNERSEISYRCEKNHFTSFPFTSAHIQYEMGIFLKRQYYRGIGHLNQLLTQEFSLQQSKILYIVLTVGGEGAVERRQLQDSDGRREAEREGGSGQPVREDSL